MQNSTTPRHLHVILESDSDLPKVQRQLIERLDSAAADSKGAWTTEYNILGPWPEDSTYLDLYEKLISKNAAMVLAVRNSEGVDMPGDLMRGLRSIPVCAMSIIGVGTRTILMPGTPAPSFVDMDFGNVVFYAIHYMNKITPILEKGPVFDLVAHPNTTIHQTLASFKSAARELGLQYNFRANPACEKTQAVVRLGDMQIVNMLCEPEENNMKMYAEGPALVKPGPGKRAAHYLACMVATANEKMRDKLMKKSAVQKA